MQTQQIQALDLLYDRYSKLVYSVAVRILNNIEEAEEVTQETFLRLWQRSEIYQPHRGSLSGFLITLTRSRSLDRIRSRTSRHKLHERLHTTYDDVTHYNPPLEAATATEHAHLICEAFKQLSAAERQLLAIAYYEGLSQSAIAKREGIPLGTVKSRSRLALKKLRAALNNLI